MVASNGVEKWRVDSADAEAEHVRDDAAIEATAAISVRLKKKKNLVIDKA